MTSAGLVGAPRNFLSGIRLPPATDRETNTSSTPFLFLALVVIVLVGFALRQTGARAMMRFTGDEARDLLQAKNIIEQGIFPSLGPKIYRGHGHLGPAYAYLVAIPLWLSAYDPAGAVELVLFLDVVAIVLMYFLGRELFGNLAGLIGAGLYAVSFTMVFYARWCWHPSLVPLFTMLLFYSLIQILKGRVAFLPVVALSQGLLLQLHLSTGVLLVPVALALWQSRRSLGRWSIAASALVFFVVLGPLLMHELRTGFHNTRTMLRLGRVVLTGETRSIVPFWTDIAQVVADQAFWPYGSREILLPGWGAMYWLNVGLVIMSFQHLVVSHWDRATRCVILAAWAILPPLSLLTFAGQRSHYYMLPWFPLPVLLVAGLLSRWTQQKGRRWWAGLTLVLLVVTNLAMYRRYAMWLARPQYDYFLAGPLDVKRRAVAAVLRDAGERGYDLLLVSWDWSNNKPYNYLLSNAATHPHEVRMLVVNPDTKATNHHFIDTSEFYAPNTPGHPTHTYVIVEPAHLVQLQGTESVADLGQIDVQRANGPVSALVR